MKLAQPRSKRRAALSVISLALLRSFVIHLALTDLTPGRFSLPDNDGCACFVRHTTHPPLTAYEEARPTCSRRSWRVTGG
jgi:hypothetical protein